MKTKDKIIEIINKYGDFSIYKAQENILNAIADEILASLQGEQEPKVGVKECQNTEDEIGIKNSHFINKYLKNK